MKKFLRKLVSEQNAFLLFYHRIRAAIAALVYLYPSRKLRVIGVTGTNGKTTTCNILAHLLKEAGYKVGMTTSINFQIDQERWDNKTKMSSQSPFFTQKMLRKMVEKKCDFAVVEVTSHAILQSRIKEINFDTMIFTNISNDHLDYHGGFANYLKTKGSFFESLQGMRRKIGVPKVLVLNADDAQFEYFDQFNADQKYTFGLQKGDVRAMEINLLPRASEFTVKAPNAEFTVQQKLIGDFNIYNALAATAALLAQGITKEQIIQGFKTLQPIPGRYEPVEAGQSFTVIVDYAHTEDALAKLCAIFKGLTKGKLILVFGSTGGGRDKEKRPKLGAIADEFADIIVLTNDDPYQENELEIIEQIASGIKREEGENLIKIVDRRTAIEVALAKAEADDTVLVAGKGCEQVIALGDKLLPWDDRQIVREVLQKAHVLNL